MDLEQLKAFLEENKENEEVVNVLGEYAPKQEPEINFDTVKDFIENREKDKDENILNFLNSKADQRVNGALETFKKGKMEEIFNERLQEMNKEETPEQRELREEREQRKQLERKLQQKDLLNKAKDFASEKGLPSDLTGYLIGEDEETTTKRLNSFYNNWSAELQKAVDKKIQDGGIEPPKGEGSKKAYTMDDLDNMSPEEINANWDAIQRSLGE